MSGVVKKRVQQDDDGLRLDRWFKNTYPALPFGRLQKLLRTGQVRVDGKRAKAGLRIAAGQEIRVPPLRDDDRIAQRIFTRAPTRPKQQAQDDAFLRTILLHEDEDLFVFNKPAGLAVQGGSGIKRHMDGLLEAWRGPDEQRPRLVHRIDKQTSGVLVVARRRSVAASLARSFRSRAAKKTYWALVAGSPKPAIGKISTYLAKRGEVMNETMQVVSHGDPGAAHAVTHYQVIERAGSTLSWLELMPLTGRTHQLRVHTAYSGYPIVGDDKYFCLENWRLPGGIQNRLHLHARRLVLAHPGGGSLDVTAPLPPHMQQSWNLLGFESEAG